MKISELISEQIAPIGTTGSTASQPGKVQSVSQSPAPTASTQQQPDPNLQKLAATLKQNKVIGNDKEVNDFISAYTAKSANQTLNPAQEKILANLAGAQMKDKTLDQKLDLQLKTMSQQKPTALG